MYYVHKMTFVYNGQKESYKLLLILFKEYILANEVL